MSELYGVFDRRGPLGGLCVEYIGDHDTEEFALHCCEHHRGYDYQLWNITDWEAPFLVYDFLTERRMKHED